MNSIHFWRTGYWVTKLLFQLIWMNCQLLWISSSFEPFTVTAHWLQFLTHLHKKGKNLTLLNLTFTWKSKELPWPISIRVQRVIIYPGGLLSTVDLLWALYILSYIYVKYGSLLIEAFTTALINMGSKCTCNISKNVLHTTTWRGREGLDSSIQCDILCN